MNIVIIGAPGSGKGTVSKELTNNYDIEIISSSDCIQQQINIGNAIGKKLKENIKYGEAINDQLILKLVGAELQKKVSLKKSILIDSMPHNVTQADWLSKQVTIHLAFYFDTSLKTILSRLTSRRMCPKCGFTTNTRIDRKARFNICKNCGSQLTKRNDDNENNIVNKYRLYQKEVTELVDFYKKKKVLVILNGNKRPKKNYKKITKILFRNGLLSKKQTEIAKAKSDKLKAKQMKKKATSTPAQVTTASKKQSTKKSSSTIKKVSAKKQSEVKKKSTKK